jgi:hypothetical protein
VPYFLINQFPFWQFLQQSFSILHSLIISLFRSGQPVNSPTNYNSKPSSRALHHPSTPPYQPLSLLNWSTLSQTNLTSLSLCIICNKRLYYTSAIGTFTMVKTVMAAKIRCVSSCCTVIC